MTIPFDMNLFSFSLVIVTDIYVLSVTGKLCAWMKM